MRPRSELVAALLHGPVELLPVSSSAHLALIGADDAALHAGPVLAMLLGRRAEVREALAHLTPARVTMHALAGVIPSAGGVLVHGRRPTSPRALAAGLLAGSALLLIADRRRGTRSRWDAGVADGAWLGVAQAAALWPGVSRNGASLAAARLRGFAPAEANRLSREVGVPLTAGAVALEAFLDREPPAVAPTVAGFAATYAALGLLDVVDRSPLWPWALYRAALAAALTAWRGSPTPPRPRRGPRPPASG